MSSIKWSEIYRDPIDAEVCEGYYDGCRVDSPLPTSNRHPAYIHGFINGMDDRGIRHGQSASERLAKLNQIRAMLQD